MIWVQAIIRPCPGEVKYHFKARRTADSRHKQKLLPPAYGVGTHRTAGNTLSVAPHGTSTPSSSAICLTRPPERHIPATVATNKSAMNTNHTVRIDTNACIGCGLCRKDCPVNNIALQNGKATVQNRHCIQCGHCVAICPKGAVTMAGFDEPPYELDTRPSLNPHELLKAIQSRRSIRHFKNKPVPAEIIKRIIEAGRWTPTAKNAQDVSYIVLDEGKKTYEALAVRFFKKLKPLAGLVYPAARSLTIDDDFFLKKAPCAIMVLSNNNMNGALAAANMALVAEACGLGVLYSGFFTVAANRSWALRQALGLKGTRAIATLVLGYPDVIYRRTAQKEKANVRYL